MKVIPKTMGAVAAVTLLLVVNVRAVRAADPNVPPSPEALLKALAESGKPGAEHKKLRPFVGRWNFTLKIWTDPNQSPAELTGTIERKWIMDGRFVQESVQGKCPTTGKSFEGFGLLGYNSAEKKFTCVKACSICGTISSSLITADASGTRFECTKEECCPLTSQKVKGRDEVVIESNDRIVFNAYKTFNDREVKVIEIVSTRQK